MATWSNSYGTRHQIDREVSRLIRFFSTIYLRGKQLITLLFKLIETFSAKCKIVQIYILNPSFWYLKMPKHIEKSFIQIKLINMECYSLGTS